MKKLFTSSLLLAAVVSPLALAQPQQGDQEITLSGAGSSDKDLDGAAFSVQGSWGQYLSERSLWGVRQLVNIRDTDDDDTRVDGATRVFYDYHFGQGSMRPFVGMSIGGIYGDDVDDTFTGGPEVGMKYYMQENTFVVGMVEYQFLFDSGSDVDDRFDDGALYYSLGIGYNF